jgi:hypothetical protein
LAGVLRAIEDGMYSPALTERVRSLIDMVVLTPEAEASRLVGERHCGLASILSLCENGGRKQRLLRIGESTVAGAGARGRDRHSLAASI